MKKIRLNMEELRVESFAISAGTVEEGTVKAHARPTLDQTCPDTCKYTCDTHICPCRISENFTGCYC